MMTTARALVGRVLRPLLKAAEGQPRRGPFLLPVTGGWLSADAGQYLNWWQLGHSVSDYSRSAVVEACISSYSQTIASLSGTHWRANNRGGRSRVTNSALARILCAPNSYQSPSDFLLNAVRDLFATGNTYALATPRNNRFEITELHLMNPAMSAPLVAETGDIFYRLGGNDIVNRMLGDSELLVPQRDVLHIRLHTNRRYPRPLVGETPLVAAMADVVASDAMTQQQLQFYLNQARPSAVLSTDLVLSRDEVQQIRDRWNEQAKGLNQGGSPILTGGLKVQPWGTAPKDGQFAELAKISAERIALAFRIPLQLLGLGGVPLGSTEALMQFWIATGLGFALNHIEQGFDKLFGLEGEPAEYTEFDTSALLRSAMKDRVDALVRGVQGGVFSPNEARNMEGLDSTPYGDEPRVQAQVIPLSAAGSIPAAPTPLVPPSAPTAKDYREAVQRDVEALTMRTKRPERIAPLLNGVAEPQARVIRKTRENALQRRVRG